MRLRRQSSLHQIIWFSSGHSTDHAIIQLEGQIFEALENNLITPGMFFDYSKSLWKSRSHDIA